MIGGLLKLIGGLVVGLVLLGIAIAVLGMIFGVAIGILGLIIKLLPFLLIGWIILRIARGGGRHRHRIRY